MTEDLAALIRHKLPAWTAIRRDLHKHPEIGFTEFRTASLVAERLSSLGFDLRLGHDVMDETAIAGRPPADIMSAALARALGDGALPKWTDCMAGGLTAVVGDLRNGDGPTTAFRFDMDALPIPEEVAESHRPAREAFSSTHDDWSHACGHDGHTTIGLATAELAAKLPTTWRGTLRVIFQPGEEGGRGALPMVAAGVVDDADSFFAAHLGCDLPSGQIAANAERMTFSSKWDAAFQGRAAHAAGNPEDGRNALLAGASAALNLHAVARHSMDRTFVNVGRMIAGSARNAIPAACRMELEVRGESDASLNYMEQRMRDVIEGAARQYAVSHTTEMAGKTIGAVSDDTSIDRVRAVATSLPTVKTVLRGWPLGGGDDAAYFMRRMHERGKPAGYFIIGSNIAASHHATGFDFEESDLAIGAQLFFGLLAQNVGC